MSASLVGSEMCIRDRLHNARRVARCDRMRRITVATIAAWARNELSPVSYTHLTLPTICSV
eukprot:6963509-Alexandrium_andersonii.AAC.1